MAAVLDASGEYLSFAGTQLDARNDYTWMTWVRTTNAGVWQGVLSFSVGEGGNQYETLEITDADGFTLYAMDNQVGVGGTVPLNTWIHVAVVKSGTTLMLFRNGVQTITIGSLSDFDLTAGAMLWGHWSTGNDQLLGRLSYSRAWSAALSQSEIAAERDSATPVRTASLWGAWPLQTDANDASGNARNLTVNGSVTWDTSNEPSFGGGGGGGITLVGVATNSRTAGTSLAVDLPAGTAEGDLMIAAVWHELANPTITAPDGWTLLFQQNVSTRTANLAAYYRQAGASAQIDITAPYRGHYQTAHLHGIPELAIHP